MKLFRIVLVDFNILYNYCLLILNLSKMKEKVKVNMTIQQVFRGFKKVQDTVWKEVLKNILN